MLWYNQLAVDILYLVAILVSILISMTVHEAMHAYVAYWLGDDTAMHMGRLSFNPMVHIDPITTVLLPILLALAGLPPFGAAKPVPFNPYKVRYGEYGAALVGISGPLTNLGLAVFAGGIMRLFSITTGTSYIIIGTFVLVNLSFFVFNMIPYPPLDGSRLLYAFAPETVKNAMKSIERAGFVAILIFLFVAFRFIAPIIGEAVNILWNIIVGSALT